MDSLPSDAGTGPAAVLSRFRRGFHGCTASASSKISSPLQIADYARLIDL
jgi:hypothetical protein